MSVEPARSDQRRDSGGRAAWRTNVYLLVEGARHGVGRANLPVGQTAGAEDDHTLPRLVDRLLCDPLGL